MGKPLVLTKTFCCKDFLISDLTRTVSHIDGDVTLRDIFTLINNTQSSGIPYFGVMLGMPRFDTFWNEMSEPSNADRSEIAALELYWLPFYETQWFDKNNKIVDTTDFVAEHEFDELHCDEDPQTGIVDPLMAFHGLPSSEDDDTLPFSIGAISVNDIADIPIAINSTFSFCPPFIQSGVQFVPTSGRLTMHPTLFCVLASICWELTFFGYDPDTRDKHIKELLS